MKILVVGAGATGCFTAACLQDKGARVALLARGAKADRLERDGVRLKDGMSGEERTARLSIVRAPVAEEYDVAMVCVQDSHRPSLDELLGQLPGRPIVWYLGNTTTGFDRAGEVLGRDRVLGGFPGMGGTWEDDMLVFADREKPADAPLDRLIVGEAFDEGAAAAERVEREVGALGMNVERYVPIMAWHWSHVAFVIPLAGAAYAYEGDTARVAADRALLRRTMRCASAGFRVVERAGFPILPKGLRVMKYVPGWLGARRLSRLFDSDFGRVAIAGHARSARAEMHAIAQDFLALAGDDEDPE
ncbi:MAG: ketopantoate reductase family protein, partial [Gaiellaceae bacterium]